MLKILLISGLIIYLVYKIGSFFFRAGAAAQHFREFQAQQKRGFQANQHNNGKSTKEGKFKGGEYIDYEEVKK